MATTKQRPNQKKQNTLPRMLEKHEVLAHLGVTYPTLWAWIRTGYFPSAVLVGKKSMWYQHEVHEWLTTRPRRQLTEYIS